MPAPKLTSPKLIPLLDGHVKKANGPAEQAELGRALVTLGPQEHDGRRFEARDADGNPIKTLPTDKDMGFAASAVQVVVTKLGKPDAPAQQ